MTRRRILAPPLLAALLAAVAFAVSACGQSDSKEVVEGEPVELGELKYNVVFSRILNPNDNEDVAYLVGQPPPPRDTTYVGVFFEVHNGSGTPQTLPDSLTITDADRREFKAIPSDSLYALPLGGEVEPEEQVPVLDSTPQQGSIEGSLALYRLPDSALENLPLMLEIPGPGGPAEVELDL